MTKRLYNTRETYEYLGVGRRFFDQHIAPRLKGKGVKAGTAIVYERSDIDSAWDSYKLVAGSERANSKKGRLKWDVPNKVASTQAIKGMRLIAGTGDGEFAAAASKSHAEAADYLTAQKQLIKLEDEQGEQYVRPLITLEQAASRLIKHKSDLGLPSVETDEYLLVPVIEKLGSLTIDRICDDTLKPFIKSRLALGRKTKTINDALAVIRRICVLAATEWQLPNKLFWLESVPKITMLIRNDQRPPRPISWAEQKRLLDNLAIHIADMALFALNTGVRSNVVCQLRWDWEVKIKLDTKLVSVFVVPRQYVKGRKRERIIICNSIAQMCVDSQRGRHEEFVFTYYKQVKDSSKTIPIYKPISRMHNTAWVSGCKRARLDGLHVHDLRHTVGMRLRSAGINERTQDEILWHSKYDMNSHYAVAQVREIYNALESIKMEGQFEESINLLALVRRTQMKSLPQSYPTHKKTA